MSGLIPFNNLIPQRTDIPSKSQSLILSNFTNDPLIWDVDHIPFNVDFSGTHAQNTYVNFSASVVTTPPGFPSGSTSKASIAFTAPGIDQNTTAQYYFEQNNGSSTTFPLSAIKAFGAFVPSETPTITNGFNILTITQGAGSGTRTLYTITLTPLATTSNSVLVFVVASGLNSGFGSTINPSTFSWSFSTNILSIESPTPSGSIINFVILQI
jgi:hypothetical protein